MDKSSLLSPLLEPFCGVQLPPAQSKDHERCAALGLLPITKPKSLNASLTALLKCSTSPLAFSSLLSLAQKQCEQDPTAASVSTSRLYQVAARHIVQSLRLQAPGNRDLLSPLCPPLTFPGTKPVDHEIRFSRCLDLLSGLGADIAVAMIGGAENHVELEERLQAARAVIGSMDEFVSLAHPQRLHAVFQRLSNGFKSQSAAASAGITEAEAAFTAAAFQLAVAEASLLRWDEMPKCLHGIRTITDAFSLATTGRSVLSLARSATKALKTVQSLADGAARFDRISAAFHSGTAAPQSLVSRCFLSAAGDRSLFKKAVRAFGGALEVSQGVGRLRKWARTLLTEASLSKSETEVVQRMVEESEKAKEEGATVFSKKRHGVLVALLDTGKTSSEQLEELRELVAKTAAMVGSKKGASALAAADAEDAEEEEAPLFVIDVKGDRARRSARAQRESIDSNHEGSDLEEKEEGSDEDSDGEETKEISKNLETQLSELDDGKAGGNEGEGAGDAATEEENPEQEIKEALQAMEDMKQPMDEEQGLGGEEGEELEPEPASPPRTRSQTRRRRASSAGSASSASGKRRRTK